MVGILEKEIAMDSRDRNYEALLLKRLSEVDLSAEKDNDRIIPEGLVGADTSAFYLAHRNPKAIYFYHILNNKLEYSTTAKSHRDRAAFSDEPYSGDPGLIRGRVFENAGKCFIVIYLEGSDMVLGVVTAPVDRNLMSKALCDLYSQIQDKFEYLISDVVDQDSRSLSEVKKIQ